MTDKQKQIKKILGIDPGLGITGYAVIQIKNNQPFILEAGCIKSNRKKNLENRLSEIYKEILSIIDKHKPDILIVEDLYSHYKHPKTAIIMGHVRGIIFLSAGINKIPVKSFSANRIKQSLTGNGHASKQQVQETVKRHFNLKEIPKPPDVADAIAVALCFYNRINSF
jgi:crossover junction endodeoxyribonuclease RuvC